jgi:16S rRNA (cytosine967-C5)-methyltransferase
MRSTNTRNSALNALKQVIIEHKSLDEALDLEEQKDLSFVKFLAYGVLREYESLNIILNQLLNKPIKTKEIELKLILLLGLFQLKNSHTPEHAAINETVELTKLNHLDYAKGLVNAILRRFLREKTTLLAQLQSTTITEHPQWLLEKIQATYPNHWQTILKTNNMQAPMHLRVNQRKTTTIEYMELLRQQEITGTIHAGLPDAITLNEAINVAELPKFQEGWISVQDLAAQKAAYLLDLKPGQKVLDVCAAPGGKSCHILESCDIQLTSMDISNRRLNLINENLKRLDLKADVRQGDASRPQEFDTLFDRILIDAPCSGTGVIRRHPDIKFLRQAKDIDQLHQLQVKIIVESAKNLKPNGLLLYATCSILREENDLTIKKALEQLKLFSTTPINTIVPENINAQTTAYGWQILPKEKGSDGFYYAILSKSST